MVRACPLGVAAAFCLASALAQADALTDEARRLIAKGEAKQAYELLRREEDSRAGESEFDYLLGIAALDAGVPDRAVLALERVLAVQPGNLRARAEIARAYLALGERENARREFEAVRAEAIPAAAKATIDRYLSAIAASATTRVTGFLEAGIGYDSNVNTATAATQIALPVLGGIIATLNPEARQRGDSFEGVSGGASLTYRLSPEWSLLAGASAAFKLDNHETQFDTRTVDGSTGLRWGRGKEAVTLGAQLQDFALDYATYRRTTGGVAQWQHSFDERHQATVFAQYSELRYPSQSLRDAQRAVAGAVYGHAFATRYEPVAYVSAYFGRERTLEPSVPQLGHRPAGVRLGGELKLGARWSLFGSVAYERRRYGGPEPVFLVVREDRQTDASVGAGRALRRDLVLLAQLTRTDNRSNVDFFSFRRTLGTVSLRVSF